MLLVFLSLLSSGFRLPPFRPMLSTVLTTPRLASKKTHLTPWDSTERRDPSRDRRIVQKMQQRFDERGARGVAALAEDGERRDRSRGCVYPARSDGEGRNGSPAVSDGALIILLACGADTILIRRNCLWCPGKSRSLAPTVRRIRGYAIDAQGLNLASGSCRDSICNRGTL